MSVGFREIEHTADWQIEVWAPDLTGLFEQAARGMYALSGTRLEQEPRVLRELALSAVDTESLLVAFLNELLFLQDQEGLGFDFFQLHLSDRELRGNLNGAPLAAQSKEIKAVTFHNLKIEKGQGGLVVRIVFDV